MTVTPTGFLKNRGADGVAVYSGGNWHNPVTIVNSNWDFSPITIEYGDIPEGNLAGLQFAGGASITGWDGILNADADVLTVTAEATFTGGTIVYQWGDPLHKLCFPVRYGWRASDCG